MFRVNIYGPLDRDVAILQSAARRFHTKKPCGRLHSIKVAFYLRNTKLAFWTANWELRGNVHTPSIARWKARGRLPIMIEHFSLSLTVETL